MTMLSPTDVLVADHGAQLQRRAAASRLAALARCCRPSAWGRATRRVGQAITRLRRSENVACCA